MSHAETRRRGDWEKLGLPPQTPPKAAPKTSATPPLRVRITTPTPSASLRLCVRYFHMPFLFVVSPGTHSPRFLSQCSQCPLR